MGDLISPFDNPAMPPPDPSGDLITSRGGDPNVSDSGGDANIQARVWAEPIVPTPGNKETANSVSGLPATPSRWTPSDTPPAPPSLEDRNPGMIDG